MMKLYFLLFSNGYLKFIFLRVKYQQLLLLDLSVLGIFDPPIYLRKKKTKDALDCVVLDEFVKVKNIFVSILDKSSSFKIHHRTIVIN